MWKQLLYESASWFCVRTCERRGKLFGFLLYFVNEKADINYPRFIHSWLCQFQFILWISQSPVSIVTEHCWHARLALKWTIKWPFLSGVAVNLKCLWRRFQEAFISLPQQLVKLISGMFGIQHRRVNWTLNLSHKNEKKEKNNTTEYLHNRLYLQFLGRKEKEKDTGNIWDKTSGIQKVTGTERQGINARHQEGDIFEKTKGQRKSSECIWHCWGSGSCL